jgi:hypothetical protein
LTPEEYLKKHNEFSSGTLETGWFYLEICYFASIGRVLDLLRKHIKFGVNLDKDLLLIELGELLRQFVNLSKHTMQHGVFLFYDWTRSKEMVPAGISGCANSILNMMRALDFEKRIHFLANACSHMGFTFLDVAEKSLESIQLQR